MVYLDWNEMWMEAMNNATWMKGCKNLNAQTARKRVEQYNKDALLREIRNNQVGRLVGSGLLIGDLRLLEDRLGRLSMRIVNAGLKLSNYGGIKLSTYR